MKIRVCLKSGFDGEESIVNFEIKDDATYADVNKKVAEIEEQYYASESHWWVVKDSDDS